MPVSRFQLMSFFDEQNIPVSTIEHEPVFTVAESAGLHERIPGGHTKNLFLKDKKGNLFLIVALHDATIDLKKISAVIGASGRVSFGKADLLEEVLGVTPGSVTPFSILNDKEAQRVSVVFDARMMEQDVLNFHPLLNNASTAISGDDLIAFAKACGHEARVLAVSEEAQKVTEDL